MFRIHFDVKTATWVLQFLRFGLFWVTVRDGNGHMQFETLENVEDYIETRGIEKMYDRFLTKGQNAAYLVSLVTQQAGR